VQFHFDLFIIVRERRSGEVIDFPTTDRRRSSSSIIECVLLPLKAPGNQIRTGHHANPGGMG
jgi:hypothetical protein